MKTFLGVVSGLLGGMIIGSIGLMTMLLSSQEAMEVVLNMHPDFEKHENHEKIEA